MPGNERPQEADPASLIVTEQVAPRELLERGHVLPLGLLRDASNAALLVRLELGKRSALAVAKPEAGEAPLWDFPDGTLHRREIAAFELSSMLGWPSIPTTVFRADPALRGPSALQSFIRHDPMVNAFSLGEVHEDALRAIALFDVISNNADRKGGHVLVDELDHLWSIDHGICFAVAPRLRTVLWHFQGEAIATDAIDDLERVRTVIIEGSPLDALLDDDEVGAVVRRIETLLRQRCYPDQPHVRPSVPWPRV